MAEHDSNGTQTIHLHLPGEWTAGEARQLLDAVFEKQEDLRRIAALQARIDQDLAHVDDNLRQIESRARRREGRQCAERTASTVEQWRQEQQLNDLGTQRSLTNALTKAPFDARGNGSAPDAVEHLEQIDALVREDAGWEAQLAEEIGQTGRKTVDYDKLLMMGRELLVALGYDPETPSLQDTPRRWASMWREFIDYDPGKVETVFESVSADQMVVIAGMRVWSMCVPSKQLVDVVGGQKRAADVVVGDQFWTLHEGRVVQTNVTAISSHTVRELVEVKTERGTFRVTGDHPFATPHGWVEARDLHGMDVEWTAPRSLSRERYHPEMGHAFGYVLGAMFSDGTVGDRYISLVVNEEAFAQRFVSALKQGFGIEANIEPVERPSGFLERQVAGFRVRVVSSYLADLFRVYAGGDANHMRHQFPTVVLHSLDTMQGFIDGYVEGDGFRRCDRDGSVVVSANIPFLKAMADAVGARFTPSERTSTSQLYITDTWRERWQEKHGFRQQDHRTDLIESNWVKVLDVTPIEAEGNKPFTVYSFTCDPYPTFLISGHLSHNCEHHMLPFWCDVNIAYIAGDHILGLSKFARIAHQVAHGLQVQERLVEQIADRVEQLAGTEDVAVLASGEHLCMSMRGIRTPAMMTSSVMRGLFRNNNAARAEFLTILKR